MKLNQSITAFTLTVAVIGFALAYAKYVSDDRKADEDRVANSWDVVTRMSGKASNGGQVSALERLVSFGIPLDRIDLHDTYLSGAKLIGARLRDANFSGAALEKATFRGADLSGADFRNSVLIGVDMSDASLDGADFSGSKIIGGKMDASIFLAKSLKNADLTSVVFVYEQEEDEDGERWAAFIDALAETRDDNEIRLLLESACAHPSAPPRMFPGLQIVAKYRRCAKEPNYQELTNRFPPPTGVPAFGTTPNPFR